MENTTNREFVSADDLNQYTMFLKKEMDAMKAEITSLRSGRVEEGQALSFNKPMPELGNGYNNGPSATSTESMEDRVAKLEKYSNYLAETLNGAIKYGEYLAESLDSSITYSKYLAENLDKNISYSKYLAENVDKSISYSEYVAENLDKSVEYSKYLAEKVDETIQYSEYVAEKVDTNISYSEYLAESLDKGISYSEYLAEKVDQGIGYSEYIAEKLDKGIGYTEYVAENLNKGIAYSEYLAENLNKGIAYSDYLAEKVKNNIAYSEYIAESVNTSLGDSINESAIEQADLASNAGLFESGFAGDYSTVSSKIDALIESVQTQKTEILTNKAAERFQAPAQTQKADPVLNEKLNEETTPSTGHKFVDGAPEEYAQVWESLNEGHKQSLIAQASFYNLETPYQIKNFWSTRQLGRNLGLQKLVENETIETPTPDTNSLGYSSDYLSRVAQSLEGKF
jgi:glutamine synthetase adenylyltransferase